MPSLRLLIRPLVVAVVALLLAAGSAPTGAVGARPGADPFTRVEDGLLRGVRAGGVDSFRGVPYAAPPLGDLRWRDPQPVPDWSGTRPASDYGGRCAAGASTNGPRSESEDCLYLNVQRPAGTRPGRRLPVYLWIHGGGLVSGSSNQHDGSLIVERTGVVVVTINYRLGVFGFLGHPALTAETGESGNFGLRDQQAALHWVHRNIGAFGGDPDEVTIGGESAGGVSVCSHLSAPGSRGTFARAVLQSGYCSSQTLGAAEATGAGVAAAVGCPTDATTAACLRAAPTAALVDATPGQILFVSGGTTLPEDPGAAVRAGRFARVPVMIGANRDEGRTFVIGNIGLTREQYEALMRGFFPGRADAVLATYPWPAAADRFTAAYLTGAIVTDAGLAGGIGGCANLALTRSFAAHTRTWAYEFDHRDGPGLAPEPAGYVWGAGHAAELAYLWPNFDNGTPIAPTFDPAERRLAADMVAYWGSFVRTGSPRAPGSAAWPAFGRIGAVQALRAGGRSVPRPEGAIATEHHCDLWRAT